MNETITYEVNDTSRQIKSVADHLRQWDSPLADQRIKAMILTKLQEAELLSLLLVRNDEEA
ncbi:MAG: hypothetical protein ACR2OU_05645 [Thermomicrobiales bacterium]